jgi:hypothetical protein
VASEQAGLKSQSSSKNRSPSPKYEGAKYSDSKEELDDILWSTMTEGHELKDFTLMTFQAFN